MKPKPPCKECTERYIGCHGKCEAYIRYQEESQEYKNKVNAYNQINAYQRASAERVIKMKEIKKRWKRSV